MRDPHDLIFRRSFRIISHLYLPEGFCGAGSWPVPGDQLPSAMFWRRSAALKRSAQPRFAAGFAGLGWGAHPTRGADVRERRLRPVAAEAADADDVGGGEAHHHTAQRLVARAVERRALRGRQLVGVRLRPLASMNASGQ